MMRGFFNLGPHLSNDDDYMDVEYDAEDAMAIMEAMGEHQQEKLLDADFFNSFEDDFDDEDVE